MEQAAGRFVKPHRKTQESEGGNRMGFWLSVLMLCLLPIERLALPFQLTVADFALVLLALYGLGTAWHTNQRLDFPLILPMWLVLVSSLVATITGLGDPRSLTAIVQEVYLFAWFIVITNVLKTFPPVDIDRLLKIWSVVASAQVAIVLMEVLRIMGRPEGTFRNPNATGAYLSISFFVALAAFWSLWLRLAFGMWLLIGVFSTGSMGALFSTIACLAALAIVYPTVKIIKNRRAVVLWVSIIGIGAGLIAAMLLVLGLWPSLLPEIDFDTSGRLYALTLGRFSRSQESRLTRIGQFWSVYTRHPWGTGPDSAASLQLSLHNDYVAFLFERGPVGAIGWLWMVGATLFASLRAACQHTDSYERWQVAALGAGFLACAMNAFTHEVSHFRQIWVLMAFLFAMSYAPVARHLASSSSRWTEESKNYGNKP